MQTLLSDTKRLGFVLFQYAYQLKNEEDSDEMHSMLAVRFVCMRMHNREL